MQKLLAHNNNGDPVYIAMCQSFYFHVLHKNKTVNTHDLHWDAIDSATNQLIIDGSKGALVAGRFGSPNLCRNWT